MVNNVASTTVVSGQLGSGLYDFAVRDQSPMYLGAVVQGTILGSFFTGNIFEFALSNYFKTSNWITTNDLYTIGTTLTSPFFGAIVSNANMQGNVCPCHFSCLTCTSGDIRPTACTTCAAPYVLTSTNTCDITCPTGTSLDSITSRKCVTVTASTITSIVFNSAFSGIDLTFDSAVQPITNTNDCSLYLAQDTNSLLGFDSYCYMSSSTVLSVLFGRSPTLLASSLVGLRPKSFLKIGATVVTYNAVTYFSITAPTTVPQPTAVLAGPNISPVNGQGVTIDAAFSTGALGRPLLFKWSVTGDLPFSTALVQALNKYATNDQSFGKLTIAASLVPVNQWVVYTVTVQNWLGGVSTLSLNSYHTLRPVPILYFTQGRLQTVKRAFQNTFQLKLSKSTYGPIAPDSLLNIRIIDTNANLTTNPWNPNLNFFAGNNMTLIIPPLTLQVGTFYQLAAELTSVLYPERNTYASLRLTVVASNLVAKIVGGDRVIGALDMINVTAAGSYDPDTQSNATLSYNWACALCSNVTGTGFFFYSQIPTTSASSLVTVTLTVSTTVTGDTRTTSEYSEFQVVAGSRSYIFIDRLTNSTNNQLLPEQSNFLNAVLYNKNSTIRIRQHVAWSATPAPVSLTPGFAPKKHFLNTRILPDNLNLPNRNYKFTLTLDEDGVQTYAWLRVNVNAQPIGCCLTVTRVLGSRNLYLFEAGMHEDPEANYPLLYTFGLNKYSMDLNFGRFTSQGNYILPAYENPGMTYQQSVYAIVTDSLGAFTEHDLVLQVYPETPAYTLSDFQTTAAQTYSVTYNQTVLNQYILASYGSYLTDKIERHSAGFSASTATQELDSLTAMIAYMLSYGDQTCNEYRIYVEDLWLIGQHVSLLSSSAMDSIVSSASSLLAKTYANPNSECWSEIEKEQFFSIVDYIAQYYPDHTTSQGQITGLLETFGFVVLRNTYPSQTLTYLGKNVMAKYWRINAETQEEFFTFNFDELNNTQFAQMGFTIPAATLTTKTPNALLDIHVIGSNFNPYAPLRLNLYPDFLAARSLERLEITENSNITSFLMDVRLYDSGSVVQDQVTPLLKPTPAQLTLSTVQIHLPLIGYNESEFVATTCEAWTPTPNITQAYDGQWTTAKCFQNATIDPITRVATCTCTHLTTFASNQLTKANIGPLRLSLNQPTLDPYYDLQKDINDNRNFMFYMNPIYLLFLLWTLHGGFLILSYVSDRESKPEFERDEYNLIARSDRTGVQDERVAPLPSFIAYWANEWFVTGLIRSTKPHYTRCARTNILFSKMYILLLVPGFFYTYYWTKNEAFNIQGYDWGVVIISLIFSAFAQGVLAVLSNTRNVPVAIKRGVYVAYFGLWTTMWLAIGFWTAKGTTQTASIWCVMWILCAFTDILILDHIYVMVKWGFDSTTDYWRAESREAAASSAN